MISSSGDGALRGLRSNYDRGSLLWFLDKAKTAFGRRYLSVV